MTREWLIAGFVIAGASVPMAPGFTGLHVASGFSQMAPPIDQDRADIAAALTRMIDEDSEPAENDAAWRDIKTQLDAAVAGSPDGELAALARRASARVELAAADVVSSPSLATFTLDTRPRFTLSADTPYFTEVRAALDGGRPVVIATAFSNAACGARMNEIAWVRSLRAGFHRVAVSIDVSYLRRAPAPHVQRCAFHLRADNPRTRSWPRVSSADVIAREHRAVPGLAFALFDAPAGNVIVRAAQRAPARMLDSQLAAVPFERWFAAAIGTSSLEWESGWCDENEPAQSRSRQRRRELCATAVGSPPEGGRLVAVKIAVGTLLEDAGDWQFIPPRVYEAFVEGSSTKADVARLSDLPQLLTTPEGSWPPKDQKRNAPRRSSESMTSSLGTRTAA